MEVGIQEVVGIHLEILVVESLVAVHLLYQIQEAGIQEELHLEIHRNLVAVHQCRPLVPVSSQQIFNNYLLGIHTAKPIGAPLPPAAGLEIPGPAARPAAGAFGALAPSLADGSAGGGDSTESEII